MQGNYEKLISVLNHGENLVEFLSSQDDSCDKIFKSEFKLLGKGGSGTVYEYTFDKKKYAVKETKTELIKIPNSSQLTAEEYASKRFVGNLIRQNLFIKINSGSLIPRIFYDIKDDCYMEGDISFPLLYDKSKKITFHNPYLCKEEYYSEYAIGLLCAQFYKKSMSIHFIDIYAFNACFEKQEKGYINDYIFMEKLDNDLNNVLDCIKNDVNLFYSLFVQLFHTIYMYQSLMISHNDLHMGNIFIKYIDKDTEFMGKKLMNYSHFHYRIGNKNIYTPFVPFIIKIGDFGVSVKYNDPVIGNISSIVNDWADKLIYTPNWFSKCYDVVYSIFAILLGRKFDKKLRPFIEKIINNSLGDAVKFTDKGKIFIYDMDRNKINEEISRMKVETLEKNFGHVTAEELLFDKSIFPVSFYKKPSKGRIITLGQI